MWIVLSNWALRSPCSIPRQVNGRGNLRPRLETHAPPELRRIVHRTVGKDEPPLADNNRVVFCTLSCVRGNELQHECQFASPHPHSLGSLYIHHRLPPRSLFTQSDSQNPQLHPARAISHTGRIAYIIVQLRDVIPASFQCPISKCGIPLTFTPPPNRELWRFSLTLEPTDSIISQRAVSATPFRVSLGMHQPHASRFNPPPG